MIFELCIIKTIQDNAQERLSTVFEKNYKNIKTYDIR